MCANNVIANVYGIRVSFPVRKLCLTVFLYYLYVLSVCRRSSSPLPLLVHFVRPLPIQMISKDESNHHNAKLPPRTVYQVTRWIYPNTHIFHHLHQHDNDGKAGSRQRQQVRYTALLWLGVKMGLTKAPTIKAAKLIFNLFNCQNERLLAVLI